MFRFSPNRSISSQGAAGAQWTGIGGPQGQYGRYREVNNTSPFPGIEPQFFSFLAHTLLVNRTEVNLENNKSSYWLQGRQSVAETQTEVFERIIHGKSDNQY
jgi:hypothetical protein